MLLCLTIFLLGNESSVDKRAEFIKGSTLDKKILKKVMPEVDAIIHLAAFKSAGESMINPAYIHKIT